MSPSPATPVSAQLQAHLDDVLSKIPTGKTKALTFGAALENGAPAGSIGFGQQFSHGTIGAYAGVAKTAGGAWNPSAGVAGTFAW